VSDQDFFFDEEEEVAEKAPRPSSRQPQKSAPKRSGKNEPKVAPRASAAPAASGSLIEKQVSLTVAALMTVIGLLLGVIIGFVIPDGGTVSSSGTVTPATGSTAPQLSPEQLDTGVLPEGHPPVGDMGGSTDASATDEAPATGE
jgi:hypothetical protein